MEASTGLEPAYPAYKAGVLPLNYKAFKLFLTLSVEPRLSRVLVFAVKAGVAADHPSRAVPSDVNRHPDTELR